MRKIIILLLILFAGKLVAQDQAPNKTFSERLDGASISNEVANAGNTNHGGDMSLSVPLVTVQSRTMSFPLALTYNAGISVDQKSGAVGLGWALPFGSIVRDYGAYNPDYTTVNSEINMERTSGTNSGWVQHSPNTHINPWYNNKDLTYELTSELNNQGIADQYHVSVPGFFTNTFWNEAIIEGDEDAISDINKYQWTMQEMVPFKVQQEIKQFTISQEFSRINEANLGDVNFGNKDDKTQFDKRMSYASAIGLLPYVRGGHLWTPGHGSSFNPTGNDRIVQYKDFNSFTITDDNGNQFVFGRPLRGQKYMMSEDPYWSTINGDAKDLNHTNLNKGHFWKIDYIAEWLLTEIRTPDFVDVNGNGKADDEDLGDWIRIEYTKPIKKEGNKLLASGNTPVFQEVPSHREWLNFSQTDRASSLMRERAYVTKIVTPTQEIDFNISKRFDVDHDYFSKPANKTGSEYFYEDREFSSYGDTTDFDIIYPVETMKYDQVTIKDRSRDYSLYNTRNPVRKTIKLNYADPGSNQELAVSEYLIRDNHNNDRLKSKPSDGPKIDISKFKVNSGRGKTTLLGLTLYSGLGIETQKQDYTFEYANNPSYSEIHKRAIMRKKFFPSLRQSSWNGTSNKKIAINPIDNYYTESAGTDITVSPFEFLIDVPYSEKLSKISHPSISSGALNAYLASPYSLPSGASYTSENITQPLHPVKDVMGYAIKANGLNDKTAWSLTKINYPTGANVAFEYESDNFNLSEDAGNWSVSQELPFIENYNDLATRRSRAQSLINDYIEVDGVSLEKNLYASFEMPLGSSSGGIRLKRKVADDGIHDPVVTTYQYGTGHYTGVPMAFVNNKYAAFNGFISKERNRHSREQNAYETSYPLELTFDYDVKMKYYAFTSVEVEKASNDHYYEYIDEVFENGARIRKTYGGLNPGEDAPYVVNKVILARDAISDPYIPQYVFTEDYNPNGGVNLTKEEHFEAAAVTPYYYNKYTYDIATSDSYKLWNASGTGGTYGNTFEYWTVETGINRSGSVGPTFLFLSPHVLNYGFTVPYEQHFKWGKRRKQMVQQTMNNRGSVSVTDYVYGIHGYPKEVTQSIDGKQLISRTEYAIETYPITPLMLEKNVLKPVTATTTYFNFVSNDNVLSAAFTTMDLLSGTYPRPKDTYVYKTDDVNHITGEFSITPYSPFAVNAPEWQKVEADNIQFNNDGLSTLNRSNQQYVKTVVGYDRSAPKASIISVDGEFDATYTGFEDLPQVSNIPIGSLPYPEYWYYQDSEIIEKSKVAKIEVGPKDLFSESTICGNELETEIESSTAIIFLTIIDNDDGDEQLFYPGDEVTVTGTYSEGTPLPVLETTIESIIPIGSRFKLCFSDPLHFVYESIWTDYDTVKISKETAAIKSGPTTSYRRTGEFSYKLDSKKEHEETTRKTPVRPLIIPNNTLISYPLECHIYSDDGGDSKSAKAAYSEICYTNYEASVWLRYDLDLPVLKADTGLELPDGVDTPCDPVKAAHQSVSYIRGTVSESPSALPVRIVYRVLNAARTTVVDEGVLYPEDLTNKWKQYTVEIPLFRGGEGMQLDVYVESDILDTRDYKTRKSIFVDDLIIYPQGAKYSYLSMDKFRKPTHQTNNNDVFVAQKSDEWGRDSRIWNAYGKQTHLYTYEVTNLAYKDNSVTETIWTAPYQYFQTRNYTDGFGKSVQSVVSDPSTNKKIITASTEYDEMGWPTKIYKSYSRKGCNFWDKHDASFAGKVADLYDSDHAFESMTYKQSLEKYPSKANSPRENDEDELGIETYRNRNLSAKGGVYGIPSYEILDLDVVQVIDAAGDVVRTFTDDFGRVVLKEVEQGFEYMDNPDGSISFTATEKPVSQIWLQYDFAGRLIKTVDPDGKITQYYYNSIGQQIKTEAPDKGTTEMKYDLFGQLRFSKSAKDLATIADAGVIDQFKYVKYDKWGRPVRGGVMREMSASPLTNELGEEYEPAVRFDDETIIDDQGFPGDGIMFNQINHRYEYDGSRATFDSDAILRETVYSEHVINGNYQFPPNKEDIESYTYRADGQIVTKAYDYEEFAAAHEFSYQYNSIGLLTKKQYDHATDNAFDFTWSYSYDNFGRPKTSTAGKSGDIALSSTNYFDALGNLYKTGLGNGTGTYSPHMDFIVSKWNIRDELVSKMSNQFRLGLRYNKSGLISDQYWSSERFDPTTGSEVNLNQYHYYYDRSQRLVGADYRQQTFLENPFAYFEELAGTANNEFSCGLEIARYREYFVSVIDEVERYKGLSQADERLKPEAVRGISFIENAYLNSQQDWLTMSEQERSGLMENIWQQATSANVNLIAYERIAAFMKGDQEHIQFLNRQQINSRYNDKVYKYAKSLIGISVVSASVNCKTNSKGTIYGFLPDFDISGTTTNTSIYDAAYWYTGNGNTSLLHRKDHTGVLTTQTYGYVDPANNLLTSVNWNVGGDISATAYSYDELGNLLFDEQNGNTIAYDFFSDLPTDITNDEGAKKYRYNSEGMRTVKNKDGNIEYYLDGVILDADEKVSSYQASEGYATIWEDESLHGFYTIKDWLGTTRVTLEESGEVTSARDHYPYGKTMSGRVFETDDEGKRYQFTGHEFDEEVNYGYHGARYYNRELGRYLSVDPLMVKHPEFSPYAYVLDNPIRFIDPNGRTEEEPVKTRTSTIEYLGQLREIDPGETESKVSISIMITITEYTYEDGSVVTTASINDLDGDVTAVSRPNYNINSIDFWSTDDKGGFKVKVYISQNEETKTEGFTLNVYGKGGKKDVFEVGGGASYTNETKTVVKPTQTALEFRGNSFISSEGVPTVINFLPGYVNGNSIEILDDNDPDDDYGYNSEHFIVIEEKKKKKAVVEESEQQ